MPTRRGEETMSINMAAKSEPPVSQECAEHGKKLRAARIAAGKTLCDVAGDFCGDLVYCSRIERGVIHNLNITPEAWVS